MEAVSEDSEAENQADEDDDENEASTHHAHLSGDAAHGDGGDYDGGGDIPIRLKKIEIAERSEKKKERCEIGIRKRRVFWYIYM